MFTLGVLLVLGLLAWEPNSSRTATPTAVRIPTTTAILAICILSVATAVKLLGRVWFQDGNMPRLAVSGRINRRPGESLW